MKLLVTIIVALALAGPALAAQHPSSSETWVSNVWQSPTHNLVCKYDPDAFYVSCMSRSDGFTVSVGDHYKGFIINVRYPRFMASISTRIPTLSYGEHWTVSHFNCYSDATGMRCRTSAGHGFWLSRDAYQVW